MEALKSTAIYGTEAIFIYEWKRKKVLEISTFNVRHCVLAPAKVCVLSNGVVTNRRKDSFSFYNW